MSEKKTITITLDEDTLAMLISHAYAGIVAILKKQEEIDDDTLKKYGHHSKIAQARIEELYADMDTADEIYKKYKEIGENGNVWKPEPDSPHKILFKNSI